MKINFHGLFSLLLVVIAIALSIFVLFNASLIFGACYLIFCLIGGVMILRVFCAKCPGRNNCGHFFPGIITAKLFPGISPKPFTKKELLLLSLIIIVMISIPQNLLFQRIELFAAYWMILIVAGIEIKLTVCTKCKNEFCPSNPLFKRVIKS
ncbi:MAG: hypothetical protein V1720_04720 [bacterium]